VSAWTPGPWKVNKYGSVGAGERGTTPVVLTAEPFYGPDKVYGSHWANLTLAAAAPTLYAALSQLLRDIEPMEQAAGVRTASGDAARAALAMARGEGV